MQGISSEIHRVSRAKGSGAWKSVSTYRFSEGIGMIESNSYISGRDRYDDHTERISDDNGKTWRDEKLVFPNISDKGNVTRACEIFLDLDAHTSTLFRVYNYGCYENDKDDSLGLDSYAANSRLLVQISRDGGETFSEPTDLTALAQRRGGIFARTDLKRIKPYVSCSHLITLSDGTVLIPAYYFNVAPRETRLIQSEKDRMDTLNGRPTNSVGMLIGRWGKAGGEIYWDFGDRIPFRFDQTSILTESSVVELRDGRILCMARGDGGHKGMPSYKWMSVSKDGGLTWSEIEPVTYTDGQPLHSPSTCCRLFRHSGDRLFFITNIYEHECYGSGPRQALHMVEIDENSLRAIKESLIVIDEQKPGESPQLAMSNFHVYEDRLTKEICVMCPKTFVNQWGSDYIRFDYGDSVGMRYRINVNALLVFCGNGVG